MRAEPAAAGGTPGRVRGDVELAALARGGVLNLVGVVLGTLSGFALMIIVTRSVAIATAGVFFESIALFHVAYTLAQWGGDVGIVRTIARSETQGRTREIRQAVGAAIVPSLVVGAILAAAIAAFAGPIGRILTNGTHGEDLRPVLLAIAPFLPLAAAYNVTLAATRGFGTMVPTNVVDKLGRAGSQPVLVWLALLGTASVTWLSVAWATPYAIGSVVAVWWLWTLLHRRGAGSGARPERRWLETFAEFWRFTAPRGLAAVFAVSILWIDTLLLGSLRSPAAAAIYVAAGRFLVFGQFIGTAIAQVVAPRLSAAMATEDRRRANVIYATTTAWLMALAWPVYLTMILFAPALLSVFGARYRTAAPVVAILGAVMLVATLVGPVDVVLLMAGKSSWNLANTSIALIANIALNLALIPRFGVTGAAIAWAVSILLNNLLPLAQVWRFVGLHPFGRASATAAAMALGVFGIGGGVVRIALGPSVAGLIVLGLAGGILYLALLARYRRTIGVASLRELIPGRAR